MLKEIVRKMIRESSSQTQANQLIIKAWQDKVISPSYGLYLLIKSIIPRTYQQKIINLIRPN